jgi:hypothetical protein
MQKFKKSVAGHAVVYRLSGGETGKINSGLNAIIAAFSLHAIIQAND